MRHSSFFDPRRTPRAPSGWLATLGASAIDMVRSHVGLLRTLRGAIAGAGDVGDAARRVVRRVLLVQIFFTGVEALPLLGTIALFTGATILIQMHLVAPGAPGDMLGKLLVAIVVRELAPLCTAVIVAGRSGTAIATELGNMKVNSEVLALSSLGIDPLRYIVFPRIAGAIASVLALMIYFTVIAILGGHLVSLLIFTSTLDALRGGFAEALSAADLALYLVKGTGLGAIVGWLCCHYGLEVSSTTEVPQRAGRAVVRTILGCVVFNTAATVAFYGLVSSPIRY